MIFKLDFKNLLPVNAVTTRGACIQIQEVFCIQFIIVSWKSWRKSHSLASRHVTITENFQVNQKIWNEKKPTNQKAQRVVLSFLLIDIKHYFIFFVK